MSEIQNTHLENIHTSKESILGLDQEKYDLLKNYPNFSTFEALLKTNFKNKDVLISVLNDMEDLDIEECFENGFTLVDEKGIKEFLGHDLSQVLTEESTADKQFENYTQHYPNFRDGLHQFAQKENDTTLKTILQDLDNINETNKENLTDILKKLGDYFNSNPQKLQEIFSSLKDDEKSYKAFYTFLESTNDPNLLSRLQTIPKDPKDFSRQESRVDKLLDTSPYFPNINKENIKKVGNILTTQVDEKKGYNKVIETGELPPSSYIEGKNGYRIKTDIISGKLLDIRGAFTNEKLRIDGQKQNLENKLLSLNLGNIENTKNQITTDIEVLTQKKQDSGLSFEEEIKLEGLQKDLKEIENLILKQQEIKSQIEKLNKELSQREDEFLRYYTIEMGNSSESINSKDTQAQDTLNFLDSIGLTHIPFSDYLKLQNLINKNQATLGVSKPLDINNGFTKTDSIDETKNSDREFVNIWNKILGKESNLSIDTLRSGTLGDRFSSSSFGENLKQTGVLNNDGRMNFETINKNLF